ncbi:MAG: ABC transporter ATP-binding protein [Treponema sp.]|jgi:iron complex transport system ATP-binding protein|nr:ABC transporter ATP-binding protein [Treponema sp.]
MDTAAPLQGSSASATQAPRLELENLTLGFKDKVVLRDISLTIKPGELVALAGPNGGGKTTLLKTIGGFIPPLAGRVLLDGKNIAAMGKREKAENISFLFQSTGTLWPFTVEETISQGRFPYRGAFGAETPADRTATDRAITAAGLSGFEYRPVTELSGGEFQRVLIARAMAQEARLLLLDEPANNLDPKYQFMIMQLIRSMADSGIGALVSIHDLNLAGLFADRIALVTKGKIAAQGNPGEVLREDILREVFDIALVITPHPRDRAIKTVSFPMPPPRILLR